MTPTSKTKVNPSKKVDINDLTGNYFTVAFHFTRLGIPDGAAIALVKNYSIKQVNNMAKKINDHLKEKFEEFRNDKQKLIEENKKSIQEREIRIIDLKRQLAGADMRLAELHQTIGKCRSLLREVVMRNRIFYPESLQDEQWAEQGMINATLGSIFNACELGYDTLHDRKNASASGPITNTSNSNRSA